MNDHAKSFRELHRSGEFLVLANAWDASSAKIIEKAGAKAIATTSAGVAWARGYADGDRLPVLDFLDVVDNINRVVRIPLSVDLESGYAVTLRDFGDLIDRILDLGAVGVNIEDGVSPPEALAERIGAAKAIAARRGIDLFVNARTDVYIRGLAPASIAADEVIRRGELYIASGCDGLFAPVITRSKDIRTIVDSLGETPFNVMCFPGLPAIAELRQLGVRRLSAGSGLAQAALDRTEKLAKALLSVGDFDGIFAGGVVDYLAMNRALL